MVKKGGNEKSWWNSIFLLFYPKCQQWQEHQQSHVPGLRFSQLIPMTAAHDYSSGLDYSLSIFTPPGAGWQLNERLTLAPKTSYNPQKIWKRLFASFCLFLAIYLRPSFGHLCEAKKHPMWHIRKKRLFCWICKTHNMQSISIVVLHTNIKLDQKQKSRETVLFYLQKSKQNKVFSAAYLKSKQTGI